MKNSSTESVFHLSIARVSTVRLSAFCRYMYGSEPFLYVTFRPGNLASFFLSWINAEIIEKSFGGQWNIDGIHVVTIHI